jgi:putative oxidoreductase
MVLILKLLTAVFISITFIQSGFDKIVDFSGNLAYFKNQFKDSIFSQVVTVLFIVLTIEEVSLAILSIVGLLALLGGNEYFAKNAMVLAALVFLQLFLGQRIAKDYAGASGIIPYFITSLLGVYMFSF